MRITVFGLGYVGLVSCACLARDGHHVLGIDKSDEKVSKINGGLSPIVEPGLTDLIRAATAKGMLRASNQSLAQVVDSEIIFICVGTPTLPNGSIDTRQVEKVGGEIGKILRDSDRKPLICLRSTVIPGSSENIFIPAIERFSGKKMGEGFSYVYHPEFLRETTAIADYDAPGRIIFGSFQRNAEDLCNQIYPHIDAQRFFLKPKEAELVKYCDNAYHALKITFANEIGMIAKEIGIDSHKVMDVFVADSKLNISKNYFKPGFAFGGSCLPKDVQALTCFARKLELRTPLLESLMVSNENIKNVVFQKIYELEPKRVAFLGISFKQGTDDLRNSPMVDLVKNCIAEGINCLVLDQGVHPENMVGQNKTALEVNLPHFARYAVCSHEELSDCDVWVLGHRQQDLSPIFEALDRRAYVLDLVRHEELLGRERYIGVCW